MSQGESRIADVDVSAGKNVLQSTLLKSFALTLIPVVLAFAGLMLIRNPALNMQVDSGLSQVLAEERARAVDAANASLLARIDALGALPEATRQQLAAAAMPEALSLNAVPLDELGTVRLVPGDYNLTSHIEIDLVRRAFNGETPPPEAVRHGGAWRLIYARGYNNAEGRGVLLAELPITIIASLLAETPQGRYSLVQQANSAATPVIGAPLSSDRPFSTAQIGNSQWFIRFQLAPSWLAELLTGGHWLLVAAGLSLVGVISGTALSLRGIPALLRKESDRILESAENKTALKVHVPALLPLARLLRQMALLSRRQLITAARKSSEVQEDAAEEKQPEAPEAPATEALAAELAIDEGALEERNDGIPAHIFRSADIRGRTEDELTDSLIERICHAVAVIAKHRGVQTLAIAYDGRPSSERLRTVVVKTLLASGRDVVDLGRAPTPLLYFATHETEYDSGIMITGGHNEDGTNGLRIVLQRQLLTSQGIQEVLQAVRDGVQDQGSGRTIKLDVEADYLDKIALDIGVALPLKVVIDANFGAAAHLASEVFIALGCEVSQYNEPGDGQRPAEGWTLASATAALGERVRAESADLGLLYDSEGDRLHTVTNEGAAVATDQLMMILGQDILQRNPGADIVYDVQCTRHFAPFVTRSGGRAVISRSGHASVRAKMIQNQAIMGGEFGGHIFMMDRWYGFDDGVYAAARLVELLSTSSESYHDLFCSLPRYVSSDNLALALPARERHDLLQAMTAEPNFPGSRVTTLDGLRIDYADSWGLVHQSTTEESLLFRFEGNDNEALERVKGVMREAIRAQAPDLDLPF